MHSRFNNIAALLRRQTQWARSGMRLSTAQFVCRGCYKNFSTSAQRQFSRAYWDVKKEMAKPKMYNSRLLIYNAGDMRTMWVSFWKALALLQFGTTLVFAVPPLWTNTNQPDPRLRKATAIFVGILGTIPTLTLAYVTAPFAHQVFIQLPTHARRSRKDLLNFASTLVTQPAATANTKLEFVTLRIFPFRRSTSAFLHELRALPERRMRLANIEIPKTDAWAERQRAKGIWMRFLEVINEPRYKFFVKEGRQFTTMTGAPGVWEEVVRRIQQQTLEAAERGEVQQGETQQGQVTVEKKKKVITKPIVRRPVAPSEVRERIKRQTARTPGSRES